MVLLHSAHDRQIHETGNPEGSLEIIDDLGISEAETERLGKAFTIPMRLVGLTGLAVDLWGLIGEHTDALSGNTAFVLPGNGAWLVERALQSQKTELDAGKHPVDISRDSTSNIELDGEPDHIIVIEDVVETGSTCREILRMIGPMDCPVTLATTLWHDRAPLTDQVLEAYKGYDNVLVGVRIRSSNELDDIRSLSTLARKAKIVKNQRYSLGRVPQFLSGMEAVLHNHAWVHQLGLTIGYRRDVVN